MIDLNFSLEDFVATGSPRFAWQRIYLALNGGEEIPGWAKRYLLESATRILAIQETKGFQPAIAKALGAEDARKWFRESKHLEWRAYQEIEGQRKALGSLDRAIEAYRSEHPDAKGHEALRKMFYEQAQETGEWVSEDLTDEEYLESLRTPRQPFGLHGKKSQS